MEKLVAGFVALGVLLAAKVSVSEAQTEQRFFEVGGTFELRPQKVSVPITSIVWKYDKNLLAEWVKDSIDLTYYSKFKGRSELNTTTGVLVVRGVTPADNGVYSVEINNQVQSRVYQTFVIRSVPQPTVEVKPLVCDSNSDRCKLICDGDVAQAWPVTYFWKKDEGKWEQSDNITEIVNNEETQRVETFSCKMKNPVSEKESQPISNKFYKVPEPPQPSGGNGGTIAAVVVPLILIGAAAGVVFVLRKRKLLCFKNDDKMPVSTKDNDDVQPNSSTPTVADGEKGP